MNILLDTNILVFLSNEANTSLFKTIINPEDRPVYISVASIGELRSIALQNRWGNSKWEVIGKLLMQFSILEVTDSLAVTYAQIDAFS